MNYFLQLVTFEAMLEFESPTPREGLEHLRSVWFGLCSKLSCISGSNIVGSACTCMPSEPSHARMVGVINSFSEAAGEQRWSGSKWAFFAPSSGRGLK